MPTAIAAKEVPYYGTDRSGEYSYLAWCWPVTIDADFAMERLAWLRISLVGRDLIRGYLLRHPDLPPVLFDVANEIARTFPGVPLTLKMVYDPESAGTETLVLYLQPLEVELSLLHNLRRVNHAIAERLTSSDAWFLVNVDLRR